MINLTCSLRLKTFIPGYIEDLLLQCPYAQLRADFTTTTALIHIAYSVLNQ